MRRILTAGMVIGLSVGAVGCTADDTDGAAPSQNPAPSIQVSLPPPPEQSADDLQVTLDPCTIGDDVISETGFDPATRERSPAELVSALHSAIGCTFTRSKTVDDEKVLAGRVYVHSTTSTLAEKTADQDENIVDTGPVAGHPAVTYRPDGHRAMCEVAIESPDGTLEVQVWIYPPEVDGEPDWNDAADPCTEAPTVAAEYASALLD